MSRETGSARLADRGFQRSGASTAVTETDALAASVEALAVLLDAGITPVSAWRHVGRAGAPAPVRRVAARVEAGATAEEALAEEALAHKSRKRRHWQARARTRGRASESRGSMRGARPPGDPVVSGDALSVLAAVWAVAVVAGAPLSPALRGAAEALRDCAEVARDVEVALSGPRSTARVVGWLPLAGAGLASLLGVDLVGALTADPAGVLLLSLGGTLWLAGRTWTARLVQRATARASVPGVAEELVAIAVSSGLSVERARRLVAETCDRFALPNADDSAVDDVLELAVRAGAPAVELLTSAAVQRRRAARAAGRSAAARLGVQLLAPLAVCVLPSFLLLGVAPLIRALISSTVEGF